MAMGSTLNPQLHLDRVEDSVHTPLRPEVSLEKVENALSAGMFSQGGKLYLFTVQEVKDGGNTENLSMDRFQRAKIETALQRLFEVNERGARRDYGSFLGHRSVNGEIRIALNHACDSPIQVETPGGKVALEKEMVGFLKGRFKDDDKISDQSRSFNFLRDLQRTVLTRTYDSTYLDSLTEKERKERSEELASLDKSFDSYDRVVTNLRSAKYGDFKARCDGKSKHWLETQTLYTLAKDLAARHSKDENRSQYRVAPPLEYRTGTKDFTQHINKLVQLAKEDGLKGIAIPIHEFYKSDDPSAVYGAYIDVVAGHVYFYNPSVASIKEDESISLFIDQLVQNFAKDGEKSLTHTKVSKHQGYHPWEPIRKFKHHLKVIESRSFKEEKEMTYFSDDDNYGRYVLKFIDEMLSNTDKKQAYNDFVSKRIRREQIEDFADSLATELLDSYSSRYSQVYSCIKV